MNEPIKVSFDFDNTLTLSWIQEYAKELMLRGIEVHVVTSRYTDEISPISSGNIDLWAVVDRLEIPREIVHFTGMLPKASFFNNHHEFVFHMDDDLDEVLALNEDKNIPTYGINHMEDPRWKQKANWNIDIHLKPQSYKTNRWEDNPLEEQIAKEFIERHYDFIERIVCDEKYMISNHEKNIVVSMIQWLGSNVGRSFLEDCGFKFDGDPWKRETSPKETTKKKSEEERDKINKRFKWL